MSHSSICSGRNLRVCPAGSSIPLLFSVDDIWSSTRRAFSPSEGPVCAPTLCKKQCRSNARKCGILQGKRALAREMQGLGVILRPFGGNLLQVGFVLEEPRESLVCPLRRSRVI